MLVGALTGTRPRQAPDTVTLPFVNGGFESAVGDEWVQVMGSKPVRRTGTSLGGYAAHGGNVSRSWWYQQITLPESAHRYIDRGMYDLHWQLRRAGYTDADSSASYAELRDFNNNWLATRRFGFTDPSSNTTETYSMWVPPTARIVRIGAFCDRAAGTELSAYHDDYEASLVGRTVPCALLDNAAGNTTTGWTNEAGDAMTTQVDNDFNVRGLIAAGNDGTGSRVSTIPTKFVPYVDAGVVTIRIFFMVSQPFNDDDKSRVWVEFRDGNDVVLDTEQSGASVSDLGAQTLNEYMWERAVPAGTRNVKFYFRAYDPNSGQWGEEALSYMSMMLSR